MTADVRVVPAERFGEASLDAFFEAVRGFERPCVGLATGDTPYPLYRELRARVEVCRTSAIAWRPVAIDAYDAPQESPCSNRSFFARWWDAIPGAPPVAQFVPDGDVEAELARFGELLAGYGRLDVAVLGIGSNGHLAFNEPGSAPDDGLRHVALTLRPAIAPAPAGGAARNPRLHARAARAARARRALLLASGAAKRAIVARALSGPVGADVPARYLRGHAALTVVLDEAAAD